MTQSPEITLDLLEKLIEKAVRNAIEESGCGSVEASGFKETVQKDVEDIKLKGSLNIIIICMMISRAKQNYLLIFS